MNWGRFIIRGGLAAVSASLHPAAASFSPPALIEPAGAARVYVTVPGTLIDSVEVGQHARAGQMIARLENRELDMELSRLQGQARPAGRCT